jgi:hypothetical protein
MYGGFWRNDFHTKFRENMVKMLLDGHDKIVPSSLYNIKGSRLIKH